MATCPEAILQMIMGMNIGLTRLAPRPWAMPDCSSQVSMPPTPVPMMVPVCSPLNCSGVRPLSCTASSAPINASCTKRSMRLASRASM